MFSFLYSSSTKFGSNGIITKLGKPRVSSYIYKDESDKVSTQSKYFGRSINDGIKYTSIHNEVEKENINAINGEDKDQFRVKVLMTKEEAYRLLSKCKNGGVLEFKDVACELAQIPTNRISVTSSSISTVSSSCVMESIFEEPLKYD